MLSTELVLLNRELQQLKSDYRHASDNLDKVRKERDELTSIVSKDKYKSIKTVEHNLTETTEAKVSLQK